MVIGTKTLLEACSYLDERMYSKGKAKYVTLLLKRTRELSLFRLASLKRKESPYKHILNDVLPWGANFAQDTGWPHLFSRDENRVTFLRESGLKRRQRDFYFFTSCFLEP